LAGLSSCAGAQCPPPLPPSNACPALPSSTATRAGFHEPLQRLATSVEALDCEPGLNFDVVGEVFTSLADALEARAHTVDTGPLQLRAAARSLASPGSPSDHARHVREGLDAALKSLLSAAGPAERQDDYRRAVDALVRSFDAVRADAEGTASCRNTLAALRAATDASFLAVHGDPPFAESDTEPEQPQPLSSMGDGLEAARAHVLSLGRAKWRHAREPAAQALLSLAEMVSAADCDGKLANEVARVRFQAERLTRSDALSFGQTGWIKAGLLAALDALDALESSGQHHAGSWASAARHAVVSIDARDLLGFQRPAIQDGFRATVDAFAVAAHSVPDCRH
jgi:hypothetical protein